MFVLLNRKKYYKKIKDTKFKEYLVKIYGDDVLKKYFLDNDSFFIYMEDDGQIVASVRINKRNNMELYGKMYKEFYQVRNLYVDVKSRGKGYCKKLVGYFIDALKTHNMPIILDVLPDNIPAVKCYLSNHFEEIGQRKIGDVLHTTMIMKI